jgi:hypothetical protein
MCLCSLWPFWSHTTEERDAATLCVCLSVCVPVCVCVDQVGALTCSLMWDNENDLDLHWCAAHTCGRDETAVLPAGGAGRVETIGLIIIRTESSAELPEIPLLTEIPLRFCGSGAGCRLTGCCAQPVPHRGPHLLREEAPARLVWRPARRRHEW